LHGYLHEKLAGLDEAGEEAILIKSMDILSEVTGARAAGYRAPWFEINSWTPALLARHQMEYCASEMGDDVPYFHENGLVEIPGQWMLEDWEQFAFNADPAWGFAPENCGKVFDLWWREFEAMRDFGCCFVLTLHPWLSGRPSRVRLLEDLVGAMRQEDGVWFARGREIADHVRRHPEARRAIDFDELKTYRVTDGGGKWQGGQSSRRGAHGARALPPKTDAQPKMSVGACLTFTSGQVRRDLRRAGRCYRGCLLSFQRMASASNSVPLPRLSFSFMRAQ